MNKVELIPNPSGLDKAIQNIQVKLSTLPWLEVCFGKCIKQIESSQNSKDGRGKRLIYPEVYFRLEPHNVMQNDSFKSYCFFHPLDPVSVDDFHFDLGITANQPVDIIFWFNMKRINQNKKYNYSAELQSDVLKVLKTATSYKPSEIYTEYENIFDPFTIQNNFEQYLKYPYGGFKIAGQLYYDFINCTQ